MSYFLNRAREQGGSAYLAVLLVMVILTIVGLTLALVTQTELELGANEQTQNRLFYAAETGLGVAAAQALVSGEYTPPPFFHDPRTSRGQYVNLVEEVDLSPFVPVMSAPCNWCPVNEAGVPEFFRVTNVVTSSVRRLGWQGSLASPPPLDGASQGRKSVSVMFEFSPWWEPPTEPIADNTKLAKVKL